MSKLVRVIDRACVRFNKWYDAQENQKRFMIFIGMICIPIGIHYFGPMPFNLFALPILVSFLLIRLVNDTSSA